VIDGRVLPRAHPQPLPDLRQVVLVGPGHGGPDRGLGREHVADERLEARRHGPRDLEVRAHLLGVSVLVAAAEERGLDGQQRHEHDRELREQQAADRPRHHQGGGTGQAGSTVASNHAGYDDAVRRRAA
jgi:hypothetical protein